MVNPEKFKPGPLLQRALDSGIVHRSKENPYDFIGIASDGTVVTIGCTLESPQVIERYLADFPTPEHW